MCGRPLHGTRERERRRVSVLFIDLAGFTRHTHNLDPESLRDLADEVLTGVASVIDEHDGAIDSFRGDGLIAVFGAPNAHANDPYRAVLAAEAGLRAIEQVGRARNANLRGRAGVTTGVVIAGEVGSGRVREYTVMGSVVNLASRLEEAATPGSVFVDEETFRSAHHRLNFAAVENIALAGFPEITRVYRLVAHAARDPDAYHHLRFIGRERELSELLRWRERVRISRRPLFGWVIGEEGRGKSRLLREFTQRVGAGAPATGGAGPASEAQPMAARAIAGSADPIPVAHGGSAGDEVRGGNEAPGAQEIRAGNEASADHEVHAGVASPSGGERLGAAPLGPPVLWLRGGPLHATNLWASLGRQLFGLREGDAGGHALSRLLEHFLPGEATKQALIVSTLEHGRMPPLPQREPRTLNPALLAWCDLLKAVAQARPEGLTLIIDSDRHDPTMDQLDLLLASGDAPLLILRSARSANAGDRRGPLAEAGMFASETLVLEPMSRAEAAELLEQIAEPELRRVGEALLAQVGGSPSAVVELALALSATRITDFQDSLTTLLQARLDLLPQSARRLLPLAAACGERCWEGLLAAVCGDVRGDLETLIRNDTLVVNERTLIPGERELRFRSSLLQRTVVAMTPIAERPRLHLRVAGWLENRAPLHLSALIAWQFDKGEAPEAAYPHYVAAAMEAEANQNRTRCDSMFKRIAALELPLELHAHAALLHGNIACERGDYPLADALLARALGLIAGCPERQAHTHRARAEALQATLRYRRETPPS
jgi:class 3 adenylate cyclase